MFYSASDRVFRSPRWKFEPAKQSLREGRWKLELKMQSKIQEQLRAHDVPPTAIADFEAKNLRAWDLPAGFRTVDSIYSVSRVGFSDDGQFAVVYRATRGESLCGSGAIYLYRRSGASWKQSGLIGLWVQ